MNVLSLFTGIGGLDLGIRLAVPEAQTVCCVEYDDYCRRVLLARMSDGSLDPCPIWPDITTFRGDRWRGAVEMVAGGFPCQDISNAGRRVGIEGERSGLWKEMLRVVREVSPRLVFIENVAAILGRGLDTVLGDLAESGYDAAWITLGADDVGAPHRRKRVFILAVLADADAGRQPQPEGTVGQERGRTGDSRRGPQAHGGSERLEGDGESGSAARPVGRGGGAVVEYSALCPVELLRGERRDAGGAGQGRQGHAASACRGSVEGLEHSAGERREEGEAWRRVQPGEPGEGLPLFPPGPADRAGWAAVLERAPHLEPAVRKLAHGSAAGMGKSRSSRVDQLRALGNSVVPQTAALALMILMERIHD